MVGSLNKLTNKLTTKLFMNRFKSYAFKFQNSSTKIFKSLRGKIKNGAYYRIKIYFIKIRGGADANSTRERLIYSVRYFVNSTRKYFIYVIRYTQALRLYEIGLILLLTNGVAFKLSCPTRSFVPHIIASLFSFVLMFVYGKGIKFEKGTNKLKVKYWMLTFFFGWIMLWLIHTVELNDTFLKSGCLVPPSIERVTQRSIPILLQQSENIDKILMLSDPFKSQEFVEKRKIEEMKFRFEENNINEQEISKLMEAEVLAEILAEVLAEENIPSSIEVLSKENIPSRTEVLSEENISSPIEVLSEENISSSTEVLSEENIPSSTEVLSKKNIPSSTEVLSKKNIPSSTRRPSALQVRYQARLSKLKSKPQFMTLQKLKANDHLFNSYKNDEYHEEYNNTQQVKKIREDRVR